MQRGSRIGIALVGAVCVGLGCAGALPPEIEELLPEELQELVRAPEPPPSAPATTADAEAIEEPEPEPEPVAAPAPAVDLPVLRSVGLTLPAGAEVASHRATRAMFVHRDAWNVEPIWTSYVEGLEAAGWIRYRTEVPPFEGLFR
ncbi:MAG: hypothetical protein AAF602_32865, partial [Myxococcota bacterium]